MLSTVCPSDHMSWHQDCGSTSVSDKYEVANGRSFIMICEVSHFAGEILSTHAAVPAFVLASHCDFPLETLSQIKSPLLHAELTLSTVLSTPR